jgi:hypothetical protein
VYFPGSRSNGLRWISVSAFGRSCQKGEDELEQSRQGSQDTPCEVDFAASS